MGKNRIVYPNDKRLREKWETENNIKIPSGITLVQYLIYLSQFQEAIDFMSKCGGRVFEEQLNQFLQTLNYTRGQARHHIQHLKDFNFIEVNKMPLQNLLTFTPAIFAVTEINKGAISTKKLRLSAMRAELFLKEKFRNQINELMNEILKDSNSKYEDIKQMNREGIYFLNFEKNLIEVKNDDITTKVQVNHFQVNILIDDSITLDRLKKVVGRVILSRDYRYKVNLIFYDKNLMIKTEKIVRNLKINYLTEIKLTNYQINRYFENVGYRAEAYKDKTEVKIIKTILKEEK